MKRFLFFCLLSYFLVGCQSKVDEKTVDVKKNIDLSDINLIIKSTKPIDSIWIADMGQKESYFVPYKDTVKVHLKRNLNDLYNIYIHSGKKRLGTQLWLDGERLLINMEVDNDKLVVKNVNSSPLYEASLNYTQTIKELVAQKKDSATIDTFIFSEIREHLDTPLAHALVSDYLYRNQNNRKKVDDVYRLMRMQTDSIQNHIINNNDRIQSILDNEAVKFAKYDLGDINDIKENIVLEDSKSYLLDFWFLRCPPCLRDHKLIKKDYNIFKENNISLISISKDDDYKSWKNYLDKHEFPWLNVREQKPEVRLTYDLSIWSYPAYVLIDSKGTIKKRFNSFTQFKHYINN